MPISVKNAQPLLPRLMLVADLQRFTPKNIGEALQAGISFVQVRDRISTDAQLDAQICSWQRFAPAEVIWSVNNRPAIARRLLCAVHWPEDAPREPGPYRLTGASVHSVEAARHAAIWADYLVLGNIYPTACKVGKDGAGLSIIRAVRDAVGAKPIFAIGGITESTITEVLAAGAYGVAICSEILGSVSIASAVARCLSAT